MDKEYLRALSDPELEKLQNEAKFVGDIETINSISLILKEREGQKVVTERLEHVRLIETEFEYKIMVYLEGGGAMLKIQKNEDNRTIANELRHFAELLEHSVLERNQEKQ